MLPERRGQIWLQLKGLMLLPPENHNDMTGTFHLDKGAGYWLLNEPQITRECCVSAAQQKQESSFQLALHEVCRSLNYFMASTKLWSHSSCSSDIMGFFILMCTVNVYCLVIDFCKLNSVIENIVYPMPRIQDILIEFKDCTVFSVMDIRHAFYTIAIDQESGKLAAFSCEWRKWHFATGLKISPAIFQERISSDLKCVQRTHPYMDDIISDHTMSIVS